MKIQSAIIPAIFSLFLLSIVEATAQQIPSKGNVFIERDKNPAVNAACGNMGGENGWDAWTAETGKYANGIITVTGTSAPTEPHFVLTAGGDIDSCTPGFQQGALPIPFVAPGFGNRSIRLGQPNTNGQGGGCSIGLNQAGCTERLTYSLPVTTADSNFIYTCAIVLENPVGASTYHSKDVLPYAEIYILDQGGDTVPCSHKKYSGLGIATGVIQPGFYAATCNGPGTNGYDVVYKPWTTAGINLSKYIGQVLRVVITNVDCGLGDHFCHSYWDFACAPLGTSFTSFCMGNPTTLVGPTSDPANPYTYTWYQNGALYTGPPSATSASITPTPQVGDIFAVNLHQPAGCNFWVSFTPLPIITSNFTSTNNSGTVNFTDLSTTSNSSPIVSWHWVFPGGAPSSSVVQNPTGISFIPGTYTVCLTTTSQAGCSDTYCQVITITPNGIEDYLLSSAINISPNPSSGNLFIDFGSGDFGNAKVFFNDMLGNLLLETTISAQSKQTLNVSAFSKGIYFLQLKTEYGSTVKKIVIAP